ncbi:MAG: hypothetical protein RLY93_02545 [Sumerlaeia bacterium]
MKTLHLTCNHCGAPLDVAENANFVTCGHCGSRLKVERTESSYSTSVLESIDRRTQDIQEDLEKIRLHHELERLDREWERSGGTPQTARDKLHEPTRSKPGGLIAGAVILSLTFSGMFGILQKALWSGSSLWAALVSGVFILIVVGLVVLIGKEFFTHVLDGYHNPTPEEIYRNRREELLKQLSERENKRGR